MNGHEPPSRPEPARPDPVADPVAERRVRIARYVKVAQRIGYGVRAAEREERGGGRFH